MRTILHSLAAITWLIAVNALVAWIVSPILLPIIDSDNTWYSMTIASTLHPYFQPIVTTIASIGIVAFFTSWSKQKSWGRKLFFSSLCWTIAFIISIYFRPGIVLRSLFVPGWGLITYFVGDPAQTSYPKEFQWNAFSKVKTGQSRDDVLSILGPPFDESRFDNGQFFLSYSHPSIDGDYWVVGIQLNAEKKVHHRVLHYYVD